MISIVTLLAPAAAAVVTLRLVLGSWRKWRREDTDVTDVLSAAALGGLLLGLGGAAALSVSSTVVFLSCVGVAHGVVAVLQRNERRRRELPSGDAPGSLEERTGSSPPD